MAARTALPPLAVVSKRALETKDNFSNYVSKNIEQVIHVELPKRKPNRLTEYDYSTPNAYFITVCTQDRKNLFWTDAGAAVDCPENIPLTNLGMMVKQVVYDIARHYPSITVDHAVVMPNHIHLLLQINTDIDGRPMATPTISTVINQTKGVISKKAGFSVWQKGFYDHVIRNDNDYRDIWNYIEGNPGKWTEDQLYISPR